MSTTTDAMGARTIPTGLPTDDYLVDGWLVQPSLNRVARHDTTIRVRPQLLDVLTCLALRPGAVVTKDELLATVWSDRIVAESGIARCIAELRQLLADDAKRPSIIETIPKRGYRLIALVQAASRPDAVRPGEASAPETSMTPPGAQAAPDDHPAGRATRSESGPAATALFSARAAVLCAAAAALVRRVLG